MKFIDYLEKDYDYTRFNPIGNFQKKNLMMAIKACELLGLNKKKISKCIHKLKSVKGRLELVKEFPDQNKSFYRFCSYTRCNTDSYNLFKNLLSKRCHNNFWLWW